MAKEPGRRIAVLGASGTVGRRIVDRLLDRGCDVVCQTRSADTLAPLAGRVEVHAFDPTDTAGMSKFVSGTEAVIFALGTNTTGATTLFSEATRAVIAAMEKQQVRRLIAITGVGAGETRGHGGFLYDRIIFPFFTRKRYADKDRQESLIAASGLDWVVVRPAAFSGRKRAGAVEVYTEIGPETRLTWITPDEVADFVVAQLDSNRYLGQRPFIGHV
ncbi:MAG: NAD(P)H-binding protein [Alphaproteobacteria bacterium]